MEMGLPVKGVMGKDRREEGSSKGLEQTPALVPVLPVCCLVWFGFGLVWFSVFCPLDFIQIQRHVHKLGKIPSSTQYWVRHKGLLNGLLLKGVSGLQTISL